MKTTTPIEILKYFPNPTLSRWLRPTLRSGLYCYHHYHPPHRFFNDHFVSFYSIRFRCCSSIPPAISFTTPEDGLSFLTTKKTRLHERVENQIISYINVFSACASHLFFFSPSVRPSSSLSTSTPHSNRLSARPSAAIHDQSQPNLQFAHPANMKRIFSPVALS